MTMQAETCFIKHCIAEMLRGDGCTLYYFSLRVSQRGV